MLKNNKVDFIQGTATFKSTNTIEITGKDSKQEIIGKHILIASGSSCE